MLSSFAGGRLFGASYGDAAPRVVALHGWGRTHADFAEVLDPFDAIAIDLPGFGSTPPPPDTWGSPEYAALVVELLRELPAPPVLVGHSLGGRVGIHVAAQAPDSICGLVLAGAPLIRVGATAKTKAGYRLARWLHQRGVVSEARMEEARKRYGSSDYRNASPIMRSIHVRLVNENYDAQIAATTVRAELVWGDNDTAAPLAGAEELAARLGALAMLTVVPGAGHLTPLTAVDALRAAIGRALA